jgi:hypothetical protein
MPQPGRVPRGGIHGRWLPENGAIHVIIIIK